MAKFLLHSIAICALCLAAGYWIGYATLFLVAMIWAYFLLNKRSLSIACGGMGGFLAWMLFALWTDFRNDHILFPQMAKVLNFGSVFLLHFFIGVLGGLWGSLGAWLGTELRKITPLIIQNRKKDYS